MLQHKTHFIKFIYTESQQQKHTHTHTHTHTLTHSHIHIHTHLFTQQDKNAFTTSISRPPNIKGRQANTTQSHKTKGENT